MSHAYEDMHVSDVEWLTERVPTNTFRYTHPDEDKLGLFLNRCIVTSHLERLCDNMGVAPFPAIIFLATVNLLDSEDSSNYRRIASSYVGRRPTCVLPPTS
ncbi:hypothetical protein TNCV_1820881 [Trichonephila clavipes]|nr:hypothetical protein TNCV_1820881 [Trichonephila clavipes]